MTGHTLKRLLAVLALLFTTQLIHSQNKPPTITLSVHSTNGFYVNFRAQADDEDGQVQRVELYRNNLLVGEFPSGTNSFLTTVILPGVNRFQALAHDNLLAQSYSEAITIIGNTPPTVTLTEPATHQFRFSTNEIVVVRGTASDSGGFIREVRLLENGKPIAADLQAPYEFLYKPSNFGSFSLQLEAVDNNGATHTTSPARHVQYIRVNDNLELNLPVNTGTNQIIRASNLGATHQKGEPQHAGVPGGKSVWWLWRPASSGTVTIGTQGSDFDTVLAVYTNRTLQGPILTNLVEVASNDDDSAIQPLSRVKFYARVGVNYYIAVDGREGVAGDIQLNINLSPSTAPPHDFIAQAVRLTSGHESNNRGATTEPGEPEHGPNSGGASIWYRIEAGTSTPSQFRITTTGSNFDTVLAVYTNAVTGVRTDAPLAMENLRLVAFSDDGPGTNRTSELTLPGLSYLSAPYWIAVDGYNGAQGNVVITMTTLANQTVPTNDLFSRPTTLVGSSALTSINTSRATADANEPSPLIDNGPSKSVWYRWVAPANGPVYMTTRWSDFDTILAVYTGTNLTRQLHAANDDDPSGLRTSALVLNAIVGTEYRIGISGYRGAAGNLIFALNQNAFYLPRLITQFQQGQISISIADISAPVVLESSSDLVHWNQVRTLSSNEPLNLAVSPEIAREFYRVRTLE